MTNNFHKLYSIEGFVCTHTLYRYCWKKASYQNFITNSSCVFNSYNNFFLIALPVSFPFSRTVPFPLNFLSHCEFNIWRFISLWRLERNKKHSRFIYLLKWIFSPSHKGTYCKVGAYPNFPNAMRMKAISSFWMGHQSIAAYTPWMPLPYFNWVDWDSVS